MFHHRRSIVYVSVEMRETANTRIPFAWETKGYGVRDVRCPVFVRISFIERDPCTSVLSRHFTCDICMTVRNINVSKFVHITDLCMHLQLHGF